MKNKIIAYNPKLKAYAKVLRNNSTLSEVLLWQKIKNKAMGVQFHRQVPLKEYIVDFYCHELQLAIEIDGDSHLYKYEYDANRQGELEQLGVTFIRFLDIDVKKNMFSIALSIEQKVLELSTTLTPLRSPQGDNPRKHLPSPPRGGNF
jgi:very-short-patch-repair endonuclease